MLEFTFGKVRVQLLSEQIIRLEYSATGEFFDGNTLFIPERNFSGEVSATRDGNVISVGGYKLYVPQEGGLSGVKLERDGVAVYTYKRIKNSGELPEISKTPEVFALADSPRISLPDCGYTAKPSAAYKVEENIQDVYLLLCGRDFRKLRQLYVNLTGRCELVRLSTLGGWNSKYYAYTQEEAQKLITDYEAHDIPLDVMVIDTDWRYCAEGWGYDINTKLFPDMKGFIDFAHARGVEVMFNDHPEPDGGAHVFKPNEIAYRESNLQTKMQLGLDIWWYDRNWITSLVSPSKEVMWETLGMYLYTDITRHYYQKVADDTQIYRRPVIMANVVNVTNGCYLKIADSASHRYSIQWTGDTFSSADALSQEIYNLIRCSDNCIPYVNSDCGGHIGSPDKEQFIRWMQFGTLSPVFRPHCTHDVERFREAWLYDEETLDIVRDYNKLRYRLLPVIYKNAFESYLTGAPVFCGVGWNYPQDKNALKRRDEYMLGNDILISPVAGCIPELLKSGEYVSPVKAIFYDGTDFQGEPVAQVEWSALDMQAYYVPPAKHVPAENFSARFKTRVKFNRAVRLFIRSDDGCTVYVDGKKTHDDRGYRSVMLFPVCDLTDKREHEIEVEYYHVGGEADCGLLAGDLVGGEEKQVYLPAGRWLDLFDGKVANTGRRSKTYGLRSMPLYVRLGALIPLANEAQNTNEQKWNKLTFDFYPDKNSADEGYLYEDDTQTTAYKLGFFRKTCYSAKYSSAENAFVIKLDAAEGFFKGNRAFNHREITFKYHLLNGVQSVVKVTVNGEEVSVKKNRRDKEAFPLNAGLRAADGATLTFRVKTDVYSGYEIKFYLGE